MNARERSVRRVTNLAQQPRAAWYRVIRNDAAPTRVDIYDEIGGHWLFGGVSAADFVAELAQISGDLEVHINSPGGDVFDGLAIYNSLAQRPGNVATHVDGLAASAASFIAQAGKTRVVAPGAMMMIHEAAGMCMGDASDMRELADLLDKVSGNIADLYATHSGKPDGWREAMQAETWYTADEAVAAGLADSLAERPAAPDAVAAAAGFDLSAYARVPGTLRAQREARDVEAAAVQWHRHVSNAAVDESAWDASKAWANGAASDDPAAFYNGICAGKKDGDPATQAAHALPHHYHPGDAPNRHGVTAALGRIAGTDGLTNKDAAQAHLDAHKAAMGAASDADDHTELPVWLRNA